MTPLIGAMHKRLHQLFFALEIALQKKRHTNHKKHFGH